MTVQTETSKIPLVRSSIFDIVTREPSTDRRWTMWIVTILFTLLVVWSCCAKLDIVAVAQGRLVPVTYVKIVQPAESGIVKEILVKEGDRVAKDQVLVRLDPTVSAADTVATRRELNLQRLQLRRIESELTGTPMRRLAADDELLFSQVNAQRTSHQQSLADAIAQETSARERASKELHAAEEVLKKLVATLPSYEKSARAYETLAKNNLVGAIQAEERSREALEKAQDLEAQRATVAALAATISQSTQRLAQLKSSYTNDLNQLRMEAVTAITRLEQQEQKLDYQRGLLELRAPQDGIVKELATTTIGAVVQPGTVLLSLVPHDEPLIAEVSIENSDIGFVAAKQPVRVKISAYQFQKYGMLEGTVKTISADSASSPKDDREESTDSGHGTLAFKALIELKGQQLKAGDLALPLAAGMQISAEIVQGKRTVLEYLLSPVQRVVNEAGMER